MSTKELYEAHALIKNDEMDKKADEYRFLVDGAIEKYIQAELDLRFSLQVAVQKADGVKGVLKDVPRMNQIYRERFKTVICKLAARGSTAATIIPKERSENDAMQYLADCYGCPNAFKNWQ